jgi:hypothetical protein
MRHSEAAFPSVASRRLFLRSVSLAAASTSMFRAALAAQAAAPVPLAPKIVASSTDGEFDAARMRALAAWTGQTLQTPHPVPFGAEIVHTETRERLMRATNAVGEEHDPSAHAEVRTIRLACARFGHQIQIPATELVKRSDMTCIVDGPIERDACFALFTDPNMQKTFKLWNSEKP